MMPAIVRNRKANAIVKSQTKNICVPIIYSRQYKLPAFEMQLISDAFLFNKDMIWELTSKYMNIKLCSNFYVGVLSRKISIDKVGVQKFSGKYKNTIDTENNSFDYRYSLESLKSKSNLDNYKVRFRSILGICNFTTF